MTDPRTDHLLDELSVVGDEHADLAGRAYLRIKVLEAAAGVHLGDEGPTFAWLIERGQPEGQVPTVWWTGDAWTGVASEARRYARADAEDVIDRKFTPPASRGGPSARAVEHGFLAARVHLGDEGLRELRAVIAAVEAACPVCGGDGWTMDHDPADETGQTPIQVPCWDAEHSVILRAALATPERGGSR